MNKVPVPPCPVNCHPLFKSEGEYCYYLAADGDFYNVNVLSERDRLDCAAHAAASWFEMGDPYEGDFKEEADELGIPLHDLYEVYRKNGHAWLEWGKSKG